MKSQLAAVAPSNPLLQLLSEQFEPAILRHFLGDGPAALDADHWVKALHGPLADFLERPGKEFRASLVETGYRLAGGKGACPTALPKMIEIIHSGSLIVDDIQDNSVTRRGGPALHVGYGVPVALNAGNWLYFWAFALVEGLDLGAELQVQVYRALSRTMFACHYGQGLDLTTRVMDLPQAQVAELVEASTRLKTGALMSFAAVLGATAAQAAPGVIDALGKFGSQLGIGLQMLDDVGGLVDERRWSKGAEDLTLGRPTWPWAWLAADLPASQYERLRQTAGEVCSRDVSPEALATKMRHALRGSGRVRVRRHLHQAFADLSDQFGPSDVLSAIEAETQRLEKSYG